MAQDRCHRLHHDFLCVEHAIDNDAKAVGANLGHHDIGAGIVVVCFAKSQQVVQVDQRQQPVPQSQHRCVVDPLDDGFRAGLVVATARLLLGAYQLDHTDLRNREAFAADLDDQRGHDRQRKRNLDGEGGAGAGRALQVDGAADLLDTCSACTNS